MFHLLKSSRKEVIPMVLTNKVKSGFASAFIAGSAALSSGLTVHAEELDGVTNSVTNSVKDIVNVITPIAWAVVILVIVAWAVVILVIVIMGCVLLWGGDKAKEKVKSHITAIVIGCILIAGAATIASWWTGSLTENFGS